MHLCRRKAGGRERTLLLEAEQEICSLHGSRKGWRGGGWECVLSPAVRCPPGMGSWVGFLVPGSLVQVGRNWQEEVS